MAAGIKSTYFGNTYIGNTYAMGTWIGYISIRNACTECICIKSAFVRSIKQKTLTN